MSTPLRLSDDLVHDAEAEALIHKRSIPKQIEYWAEIGKAIAHTVSNSDLLALMQGIAQVQIAPRAAAPVDPLTVLASIEEAREDGTLRRSISQARIRYEASPTHPGLLDRIHPDGHRETGRFLNGEFVPGE